jgi:hypothetical protein
VRSEVPDANVAEQVAVVLATLDPAKGEQLTVTGVPISGSRVSDTTVPMGTLLAAIPTVTAVVAVMVISAIARFPEGFAGTATLLTEVIVTLLHGSGAGILRGPEKNSPVCVPLKLSVLALSRMRPLPPVPPPFVRGPPLVSSPPAPEMVGAIRWITPPEPPPP